jgi:cytidylate kinase
MKDLLITIDGPAGAGKTTVSRTLADRLGYTYVDTGALYRAVALEALAKGIAPDDELALETLCRGLTIEFCATENGVRLLTNQVDVTDRIRTPRVTMMASAVSARPAVRDCLLSMQRELGARKAAVFEGRDMGTVIFPDADCKFFLTADLEARARRRYLELPGDAGQSQEDVLRDMERRDQNDSGRQIAPLKPAPDAVIIDSTAMSIDEVVQKILDELPV